MKTIKILTVASAIMATVTMAAVPAQAQGDGTQFIGQISAFAGNFCPRQFADASGQLLQISQNTALFAVIGTQFGGDGRTTMALPDLRGRRPIGFGNGPGIGSYSMGQRGGSAAFTLNSLQLPSHNHTGRVRASPLVGDTTQPVRNDFARAPTGFNTYLDGQPAVNAMAPDTLLIDNAGGNQSVNKLSPFTVVRWCIALQGVFPSRN